MRGGNMTQGELLRMLDTFDKMGAWAFKLQHIKMYFKDESPKSLQVALHRHAKNHFIEKCAREVYVNPRAKKPLFFLESLASLLRDNATFYLSLETLLSELGLISQFPNRLTFISQGRSQVFKTSCGIIEFVHSKRNAKDFLKHCYFDKDRGIYVAHKEQAINDIYQHNRSVDLYEEQLKKDGYESA